ncbi:MAG: hypothetical protein PHU46_01045 [Rhodocyclaceae bacterium]|nr:hypothetical protein [Rhodocyclaceae bacterium]
MKLKLVAALFSALTLSAAVIASDNSATEEKTGATMSTQETIQDGRYPILIAADNNCQIASLRHCSNVCNGEYGMLCFPGTVCNPDTHRCEKTSP